MIRFESACLTIIRDGDSLLDVSGHVYVDHEGSRYAIKVSEMTRSGGHPMTPGTELHIVFDTVVHAVRHAITVGAMQPSPRPTLD